MLAVTLFVLTLGQTAPEAAERPQPRWSVRPRVEPTSLYRRGLDAASATIRCRARPDGQVEECQVTAEEPRGSGLGRELVAAAREARIDPATLASSDGGWVSFTARFRLD